MLTALNMDFRSEAGRKTLFVIPIWIVFCSKEENPRRNHDIIRALTTGDYQRAQVDRILTGESEAARKWQGKEGILGQASQYLDLRIMDLPLRTATAIATAYGHKEFTEHLKVLKLDNGEPVLKKATNKPSAQRSLETTAIGAFLSGKGFIDRDPSKRGSITPQQLALFKALVELAQRDDKAAMIAQTLRDWNKDPENRVVTELPLNQMGTLVTDIAFVTPTEIFCLEIKWRSSTLSDGMAIYDKKLANWPLPYETRMVDTTYGKVHVIVSGAEDAPPLLLLHASAMSGWSWRDNIAVLGQHYRTYAIDLIGESNRSVLNDAATYPADGEALAHLYAEIADALGVERANVVGASFGGFIATNYARYYPERVERLALLGPMGLTPSTAETALRIMFVQFFPLQPIQSNTVHWALGDDPYVLDETAEWFGYVVMGVLPRVAAPRAFTPVELQEVSVPLLLVIGTRDNLTGDPQAVRELAENVPDIDIQVLDSAHLIGMEKADEVNALLLEFFQAAGNQE